MLLNEEPQVLDSGPLEQAYRYLGKGGQSYVFVSVDGRYVLKLLRSSKLVNLQLLYTIFPLSSFKTKITSQENLLKQTLLSYAIANQYLKNETGLIGIHIDCNSTLSTPLKIIDRLGISHILDPNEYPFVIQKRAVLLKERIAECMQTKNLEAARSAIKSTLALILQRMEKGIVDGDPNLTKNFGFCGNQPIQIDGGRFSLIPSSEKIGKTKKQELQQWIDRCYPELSSDLDLYYEEFLHEAL